MITIARVLALGVIYFARHVSSGYVKIGYSANVPLRVRQLRARHGPLELLAVARGTPKDERKAHRSFGFYRVGGEWFEPRERLIAYVALVAARGATGPAPLPTVPSWLD